MGSGRPYGCGMEWMTRKGGGWLGVVVPTGVRWSGGRMKGADDRGRSSLRVWNDVVKQSSSHGQGAPAKRPQKHEAQASSANGLHLSARGQMHAPTERTAWDCVGVSEARSQLSRSKSSNLVKPNARGVRFHQRSE